MFFDEGVVCERNSLPADLGLSSLQDELTNRLQVGKSGYRRGRGGAWGPQAHLVLMNNSSFDLVKTQHSPPRHVGFHHLQHGHRGLVNFDKGPAEDLPQAEHVDDVLDLGTDTFNPGKQDIVRDYWQR